MDGSARFGGALLLAHAHLGDTKSEQVTSSQI